MPAETQAASTALASGGVSPLPASRGMVPRAGLLVAFVALLVIGAMVVGFLGRQFGTTIAWAAYHP